MAICDRIRELRLEIDISQKELAERTGINKSTISDYEMGKKLPTAQTILQLVKFFGVDANYLLQDEMAEVRARNSNIELSKGEEKAVMMYRELDDYGKDVVDTILEKEHSRTVQQRENDGKPTREDMHKELDRLLDLEKGDESPESKPG